MWSRGQRAKPQDYSMVLLRRRVLGAVSAGGISWCIGKLGLANVPVEPVLSATGELTMPQVANVPRELLNPLQRDVDHDPDRWPAPPQGPAPPLDLRPPWTCAPLLDLPPTGPVCPRGLCAPVREPIDSAPPIAPRRFSPADCAPPIQPRRCAPADAPPPMRPRRCAPADSAPADSAPADSAPSPNVFHVFLSSETTSIKRPVYNTEL